MYNDRLTSLAKSIDEEIMKRADRALKSLVELGIEPEVIKDMGGVVYFEWMERPLDRWASLAVSATCITVSLNEPGGGMHQFMVNEDRMTQSLTGIRMFLQS